MEATCILETTIYEKDWENQPHNKKTLEELFQETHLKWDQELTIALVRIRVASQSRLKLSPFEIVYEQPFQVSVLRTLPLNIEHESKINMYTL